MRNDLYKKHPNDIISWVDNTGRMGVHEFTFDGKRIYNLFLDYPQNLTKKEKAIFDKENPFWFNFFRE